MVGGPTCGGGGGGSENDLSWWGGVGGPTSGGGGRRSDLGGGRWSDLVPVPSRLPRKNGHRYNAGNSYLTYQRCTCDRKLSL